MADCFAGALRRLLRDAEARTDFAIFFALGCLKTFFFRSIASLVFVTRADHFFFFVFMIRESIRRL